MLFAGLGSVRKVKNCDRGLEKASGRGQHFQARGHSFSTIRTDPKPANNFFFCDKLNYKWVYATLSLNWPGLRAVCKPSCERASKLNLDFRQRKMY